MIMVNMLPTVEMLKNQRENLISEFKHNENIKVSEIEETHARLSFRVFKNRNTILFYEARK